MCRRHRAPPRARARRAPRRRCGAASGGRRRRARPGSDRQHRHLADPPIVLPGEVEQRGRGVGRGLDAGRRGARPAPPRRRGCPRFRRRCAPAPSAGPAPPGCGRHRSGFRPAPSGRLPSTWTATDRRRSDGPRRDWLRTVFDTSKLVVSSVRAGLLAGARPAGASAPALPVGRLFATETPAVRAAVAAVARLLDRLGAARRPALGIEGLGTGRDGVEIEVGGDDRLGLAGAQRALQEPDDLLAQPVSRRRRGAHRSRRSPDRRQSRRSAGEKLALVVDDGYTVRARARGPRPRPDADRLDLPRLQAAAEAQGQDDRGAGLVRVERSNRRRLRHHEQDARVRGSSGATRWSVPARPRAPVSG